jgi:hypothetical protein
MASLFVPKTSSADEFGASSWLPRGLALFLQVGDTAIRKT